MSVTLTDSLLHLHAKAVHRTKRLARFAADYLDLLVAAALAILFSYLGARNALDGEALTQAAIALLGVLAVVIFRERWERRDATDSIKDALIVAKGQKPWQVLDEKASWDLVNDDGSFAKATLTRDLQFMQDEVFVVYEFQYKPVGRVKVHRCFGAARDEPEQDLPIIHHDFQGLDGRVYRLISLQRVWRRGEIMRFRSERELEDQFLDSREVVSKEVAVATSRCAMEVAWPKTRRPTAVWLERTGQPTQTINLATLHSVGGRPVFRTTITDPQLGERIIIRWDW